MIVEIDQHSGCCHGVKRAIEQAEMVLKEKGCLYSLGAIVHNSTELDRLSQKGLKIVGYEDLNYLKNTTVLFRAHGEPPSIYNIAREKNIDIIDCTCPVVLKLQKKIASTYQTIAPAGGQIIIFGKRGHAEVNGLIGQVDGDAIVIEKVEDIFALLGNNTINTSKPIALFSQTTKDSEEFIKLGNILKEAVITKGGDSSNIQIYNTICKQVSSRYSNLTHFASKHSVIVFVCGRESSNGRILTQLCQRANPRTYQIEDKKEIDTRWFKPNDTIGICGATSTPEWQLEEIATFIKELEESGRGNRANEQTLI